MAELFYKMTKTAVARVETVDGVTEMSKFVESIPDEYYCSESGKRYTNAEMLEMMLACETVTTEY